MAHLTDKLKNQSESHKQAQDNLHEQVQEQKIQLRSAEDRAQSLQTSVTELTAQLTENKEKVAQLDSQVTCCTITHRLRFHSTKWWKQLSEQLLTQIMSQGCSVCVRDVSDMSIHRSLQKIFTPFMSFVSQTITSTEFHNVDV